MNKKELKKALRSAFNAPAPEKKAAFLRRMPAEPVSHGRFMLSQAGYIRKSTLALSAAVFALALAFGGLAGREGLWSMVALTPFMALLAVTESGRSAVYAMEELELATRFSLKSVVLARMGLMGLSHFVLLGLLAFAGEAGLWRTGVYLLTPYLLTSLLSMAAARRVRGRESVYVCGALAALVSGINSAIANTLQSLYAPAAFPWWLGALALCLALTGWEHLKTIKKTEEISWSL